MFSREELVHIYKNISDEDLKDKISKIIFSNNEVVTSILKHFDSNSVFAIDKMNNENVYIVHFSKECLNKIDFFETMPYMYINYSSNDIVKIKPVPLDNEKYCCCKFSDSTEVWNKKDGYLDTILTKKDA